MVNVYCYNVEGAAGWSFLNARAVFYSINKISEFGQDWTGLQTKQLSKMLQSFYLGTKVVTGRIPSWSTDSYLTNNREQNLGPVHISYVTFMN